MKIQVIVILIAAVFAFGSCGGTATNSNNIAVNSPKPTPEQTPFDEFAFGRQIYSVSCGACHKEDGIGGKVSVQGRELTVTDLTSEKSKKLDEDKITLAIYNGKPDKGMPAFKDRLSEPQIREVVKYVRSGIQKIVEPTPSPDTKVANPPAAN